MTFAPPTLKALGSFWEAQGGVNLGIVGDTSHQEKGTSYHLGKDNLEPNAYSARLPRDVAGLTNAASAIDLGKLDGSFVGLRDFSKWLVGQCQKGQAEGTRDVREIIYSPDGLVVQRWSGVDNQIHTGAGNGDASHRFHTHISYYRDSQFRAKVPLFRPYFEVEDDMLEFTLDPAKPHTGTVQVVGDDVAAIFLDTGALVGVFDGEEKEHIGFGKLKKPYGTGTGAQADRQSGWLLYGPRPAWLLAYAGREVPSAGATQTLAVSLEGVEVFQMEV